MSKVIVVNPVTDPVVIDSLIDANAVRNRGMIGSVPNQPKTPHRTIRVADEVWLPAMAKAVSEGSNLSKKIREWLDDYVKDAS